MSENIKTIYDKFSSFTAFMRSMIGDQAIHLNAGLQQLSLQLGTQITPEQRIEFEENIRRSRYLMREIIDFLDVYNAVFRQLREPNNEGWEKVNVYDAIGHASEDAKRFVGDFSEWVVVNTNEKNIVIHSQFSLIRHSISAILVCIRLRSSSSKPIFINISQTEIDVTLKLSEYVLSSEDHMDFIDQQAYNICLEMIALILPVLNGTFDWRTGPILLDDDEITVLLLKNASGSD